MVKRQLSGTEELCSLQMGPPYYICFGMPVLVSKIGQKGTMLATSGE